MRLIGSLRNRGMKACLVLLAVIGMAGVLPQAHAAAGNNNVKIVAFYGAGNLSKSEYARDTIILFNPTGQDIDMTGWTIQIGGTSGSFTGIYSLYALPLTSTPTPLAHPVIKAGGYFAIAGSGNAYTSGTACNTTHCFLDDSNYDAQLGTATSLPVTNQNTISSTAAVIAISTGNTSLGTSCTTAKASTALIDLLGVESADGAAVNYTTTTMTPTLSSSSTNVSCYAGGGPSAFTPSPLNYFTGNAAAKSYPNPNLTTYVHGTTYAFATIRKNRCVDTFNNYADFTLGYIGTNPTLTGNVFPNSQTPAEPCPSGSQMTVVPVANPQNPAAGASFTITAKVVPAAGRTVANVMVDTSELASGTNSATYVAPTWVPMTAGANNNYTVTLTMPSAALTAYNGQLLGVTVIATDSAGDAMSSAVQMGAGVTVPGPGNHDLVMTAFYGAGSLGKSQYSRDTIILFNPTQHSIDAGTYMLVSGGTTGAFGTSTTAYTLASAYHIGNTSGGTTVIPPGGFYSIAASGHDVAPTACTGTNAASPCNNDYAYDYTLGTIEAANGAPPTSFATNQQNIISSTATIYGLINNSATPGSVTTYPPGATCPLHSPRLTDIVSNGSLGGAAPVSCYPGTDSAHYIPNPYNGAATLINGVVYPFAAIRGNPCSNQFDEAVDWQVDYIDFENSHSATRPCPVGQPLLISASANPSAVGLSDNLTITATLTPASNSSTDMVTADLSVLGLGTAVNLGNSPAGSNTYSVTVQPLSTSGFSIGLNGVLIPSVEVTATDTANNRASTTAPVTIIPGTIVLTETKGVYSLTVKSGGVAVFPLTLQALHGYTGVVTIGCTGSPNTNSLGVPVGMQCVTTPPEITLPVNGSATCQLGISAGTTFSAGLLSRSFYGVLISLLSLMVLGVAVFRRKQLPVALAIAFLALVTAGSTGCATNAGLNNTGAAPGTYTFVVTATDTTPNSIVHSTINLTVIVQ